MARARKKAKPRRKRIQFRIYDIYRCAVTGEATEIKGIVNYECNKDASVILIHFCDPTGQEEFGIPKTYFAKTEEDLYNIVYNVNIRLGNCVKPGRKKWRNNYVAQ